MPGSKLDADRLVRKHEFANNFIRLLSYEGGVKIGL